MMNTLVWGAAHVLATISHFIMGIVGIITFNNTAIQALEDFWAGAALGSSPVRQVGEASLLQGITAVGWVGFVFNLTYFPSLLWSDHKVSINSSRKSFFKRKITVLIGVIFACGVLIGDIALASMIGVKGASAMVGPITVSAIAGFLMAVTIVADLVKLYGMDSAQEKLLGGTEKSQQQA